MSTEVVTEVARAAPPVVATGLTLFGVSMSDWLVILTIAYTVAQMHFLFKEKSPMYRGIYYKFRNFFLRRKDVTGS
ncbi:MAG: hypothetical protein ACRC0J_23135 [Shewanella oncorhynchi]